MARPPKSTDSPRSPVSDSTPKPRPSRGRSGKPVAPPAETQAGTPGFGEQSQAPFTASGPLTERPDGNVAQRLEQILNVKAPGSSDALADPGAGPGQGNDTAASNSKDTGNVPTTTNAKKLPALRSVKPRPEDFSPSAGLNALLAKPEERSDHAKELVARQPMMAAHPLYDDFWKERCAREVLGNIKVPIYCSGVWSKMFLHVRGVIDHIRCIIFLKVQWPRSSGGKTETAQRFGHEFWPRGRIWCRSSASMRHRPISDWDQRNILTAR